MLLIVIMVFKIIKLIYLLLVLGINWVGMFIKYIVIVMNVDYLWNNLVNRNVIVIEFKLWLKVIV